MPESEIKSHLRQWAQAYGGEQLQRLGYAGNDRLSRAALVSGDAVADRVESIVAQLETQGRWKEARVLRAEFFMEGLDESERLRRLDRCGLRISRTSYYTYLNAALAVVEFALCGVDLQGRAAND